MATPEYFDKYDNLAFGRDSEGVLLLRLRIARRLAAKPALYRADPYRPHPPPSGVLSRVHGVGTRDDTPETSTGAMGAAGM